MNLPMNQAESSIHTPPASPFGFLALSLAIVAADQVTKMAILAKLVPRGTVRLIPGLFDLTFVANQGALFGFGREFGGAVRMVAFTILPIAAICFVLLILLKSNRRELWFRLGLALILGGAAGNLIDRIRLGFVVDFLDVYWGSHHWPAFNLGDASICLGVGLLGLDLFGEQGKARQAG